MPEWWRPYVLRFVSRVQWVASQGGLQVTSWKRSMAHNRAVGGASNSQHLVWTAVDLVPDDGDLLGLERVCRQAGFGYVLNEGDHIHVQEFPAGVLPPMVFQLLAA